MIEICNLSKKFDDKVVLRDVNFTISEGSVLGLVGTNGAGKSTLIRLITGIYTPDEGEVKCDGETVFDNESAKEKMVLIPDELYFLPNAGLKRMSQFYEAFYKDFDRKKFDALVETFKFDVKKSLAKMSKGMKRQAAMILALSVKAKYLFLDETFDGLDPVIRGTFKKIILKEVEDNNMSVILASHSLRELEGLCDSLALVHNDSVVFSGNLFDLKSNMFKVQVAFKEDFTEKIFSGIDVLNYEKNGGVVNLIIRGDKDITLNRINEMKPVILEMVPLNLEEIFTYEMKAAGYSFDTSILEVE